MYVPKHFSIEELVPPPIYERRGEKAWQLLDDRMLQTIDQMREALGPMIINTWHSKKLQATYGYRQYSGLRTIGFYLDVYGVERGTDKYTDSLSQHKYGRAFDALFRDHSAEDVRQFVKAHPAAFPFLTAMELGTSWFHGDVRNVKGLMEFYP